MPKAGGGDCAPAEGFNIAAGHGGCGGGQVVEVTYY